MENKNLEDLKPVLDIIKIGRNEFIIKKGDYILYNYACYQFCSGDGRILKYVRYTGYPNIVIANSTFKNIPFDKMIKIECKMGNIDVVKWIF